MLGMKSNRSAIKGVFADKLREQIAIARIEREAEKAQAQTKSSEEFDKINCRHTIHRG